MLNEQWDGSGIESLERHSCLYRETKMQIV